MAGRAGAGSAPDQNFAVFEASDGQVRAVEETEGRGKVAFRQGDGAGIEDRDAFRQGAYLRDVRVAVREDRALRDGRDVCRVPEVSVRDEEPCVFGEDFGEVRHDGELDEKLVDVGIAVASHGEDLFAAGIEQVGGLLRIVPAGDTVAGPW